MKLLVCDKQKTTIFESLDPSNFIDQGSGGFPIQILFLKYRKERTENEVARIILHFMMMPDDFLFETCRTRDRDTLVSSTL